MKAYKAYEKDGDFSTIVFAENASQAKMIAKTCDCCEDARYIDIRVHRIPAADDLYNGRPEIDWYNEETRVRLVRDFGWSCYEPAWECNICTAKPYCKWHEEDNDERQAD